MSNTKHFLKFEKKHILKGQLIELYKIKKLSIKQISSILGLGVSTVHRKLHRYNIKVRPTGKKRIDITFSKTHRLMKKNLTLKEIAQYFNCNPYTIRKRMDEYGIKYREKGQSITHYPKKNFDGDPEEAAYLVGFSLGDLAVKMEGELIYVKMSTTKGAQIKLFKKLFKKYTYVRKSKRDRQNAVKLDCYLNNSFNFLLVKKDNTPDWISRNSSNFSAFVAGYIDAEGSFGINQGRARFKMDSYDKNILHQIHWWLIKKKINSKLRLIGKEGQLRPDESHFNDDLWRLNINEAQNLIKFINIINPFISHRKRIKDINIVLDNIKARKQKGTI